MKNKQLPIPSTGHQCRICGERRRNNVNRAEGLDCLGGNGSWIPDCEVVLYGRTVTFDLFLQD